MKKGILSLLFVFVSLCSYSQGRWTSTLVAQVDEYGGITSTSITMLHNRLTKIDAMWSDENNQLYMIFDNGYLKPMNDLDVMNNVLCVESIGKTNVEINFSGEEKDEVLLDVYECDTDMPDIKWKYVIVPISYNYLCNGKYISISFYDPKDDELKSMSLDLEDFNSEYTTALLQRDNDSE